MKTFPECNIIYSEIIAESPFCLLFSKTILYGPYSMVHILIKRFRVPETPIDLKRRVQVQVENISLRADSEQLTNLITRT